MSANPVFNFDFLEEIEPESFEQPAIDSSVWQRDATITEAINKFEAKEPTS